MESNQKQAATVVMNDKALNTNGKLKKLNILNVFIFMFCSGQELFLQCLNVDEKKCTYPTRYREGSHKEKSFKLNETKFLISSQGPRFWNEALKSQKKSMRSERLFKKKTKDFI